MEYVLIGALVVAILFSARTAALGLIQLQDRTDGVPCPEDSPEDSEEAEDSEDPDRKGRGEGEPP